MLNFKNFNRKRFSFLFWETPRFDGKLLITLICFTFIGTSIYGNFDDLADQTITIKEVLWLSFGILFSFLSIIINAYAWKFLINSIGCNSDRLDIIKIFLNTNIYKYFPGGIWHFVTRYNNLRLEFSKEKSVESVLLEPLLMLVAAVIFIPFGSSNIFIFIFCWSSTLVFLNVFREFIINNLKRMKASIFANNSKVIDRNLVQDSLNSSIKRIYPYKSLFVEIVFILFRFLGFLCCVNAFSIRSLVSISDLISSFSLAWIIGLIVPAAPGGIGIFESVILLGLGSKFPEAPLLASLLCYRLVSTVSDILSAFVYPVKRLLKL